MNLIIHLRNVDKLKDNKGKKYIKNTLSVPVPDGLSTKSRDKFIEKELAYHEDNVHSHYLRY